MLPQRNLLSAKHLNPNLQAVEDRGQQEQNDYDERGNGGDAGKAQEQDEQPGNNRDNVSFVIDALVFVGDLNAAHNQGDTQPSAAVIPTSQLR
jgi:hypothetical protein